MPNRHDRRPHLLVTGTARPEPYTAKSSGGDRISRPPRDRLGHSEKLLSDFDAARAEIDDLAVTTDLIVGFPGETEDDFVQTLELAAAADYDSAYSFIYSPRPGTEASELTDRYVDPDVIAERFDRLKAVLERSALHRHQARIGRLEEIVVEGPSRKDPTITTGRTRQNKLVHFAAPEPLRVGTYATARITGAAPHFLRGELVDVLAPARHRTRIPVAAG